MTSRSRALVEVHVAALLYGFIGPFGKAVDLNPHQIVFWRTSLAAVVLLVIARRLKSHTLVKNWADLATFTAIAGLLAVHWVLFFKSIKVSTVAIGLVTTYTYPVLMVFLESWFFNLRLKALDFVSAVAVLVGIYYLTPEFDLSDATFQGVIYGVAAGAMIPFMLYDGSLFHMPSSRDLLLLVVLGVVLTGFARVLFVNSQRHLSGKVVGITLVLEVVYGVILALIFLAAVPSKREIIGGLIIVSVALFESLRSRRHETAGKDIGESESDI